MPDGSEFQTATLKRREAKQRECEHEEQTTVSVYRCRERVRVW